MTTWRHLGRSRMRFPKSFAPFPLMHHPSRYWTRLALGETLEKTRHHIVPFSYIPRILPWREFISFHTFLAVAQSRRDNRVAVAGGMDLKEGMLFAGNVVDGRVHELGGWMLRIQHMMQQNVEVGQAVSTGPGGSRVGQEYDQIIHTVPPFYKHHEEPEQYLATCYQNALSLAISRTGSGESVRIACPLIESGSREFPTGMAFELQQKNQYSGEMWKVEKMILWHLVFLTNQ